MKLWAFGSKGITYQPYGRTTVPMEYRMPPYLNVAKLHVVFGIPNPHFRVIQGRRKKHPREVQSTLGKKGTSTGLSVVPRDPRQLLLYKQQLMTQMTAIEKSVQEGKKQTAELLKLIRILTELHSQTRDQLKESLVHERPEVRFLTSQVIAAKRVHLESDLIDRLTDKVPDVGQAARSALFQLSGGKDYGPEPKADAEERQQSVSKWRAWWEGKKEKARMLLAKRPRSTVRTLRRNLTVKDADVRCAVVMAVALKKDKSFLRDLIYRLEDKEEMVARAACASLGKLTGQDPAAKAGAGSSVPAQVAAWKAWWDKQH